MVKKKNLVWQNCSEEQLRSHIKHWLSMVDFTNSILFLEGDMGAGKSTFVREILAGLAPEIRSQGSPTFPLVQTYLTKNGTFFYHIDLYRLKNEGELSESGIESQIEEQNTIVCVEWASLFAGAFAHWFDPSSPKRKIIYLVKIEQAEDGNRNYEIELF